LLKIPSLVMKEFQQRKQNVTARLEELRERMEMIIDGTRKRQVCAWWLSYIESEEDVFLQNQGYHLDCLPYNYTTEPPQDMETVQKNLVILRTMLHQSTPELNSLLKRLMNEIYTVLDELLSETKFALEYKEGSEPSEFFEQHRVSLERDMEYLLKMKSMDEEIKSRRESGILQATRVQMTDVVPVGGLVMARLHILECELRTALELWANHKSADPCVHKMESGRVELESGEFDKFTGGVTVSTPIAEGHQFEYVSSLMASCSSWAPKSCVNVAIKQRSSRNLRIIVNKPQSIRLAKSRAPGQASPGQISPGQVSPK
jgi:hypothetical protein